MPHGSGASGVASFRPRDVERCGENRPQMIGRGETRAATGLVQDSGLPPTRAGPRGRRHAQEEDSQADGMSTSTSTTRSRGYAAAVATTATTAIGTTAAATAARVRPPARTPRRRSGHGSGPQDRVDALRAGVGRRHLRAGAAPARRSRQHLAVQLLPLGRVGRRRVCGRPPDPRAARSPPRRRRQRAPRGASSPGRRTRPRAGQRRLEGRVHAEWIPPRRRARPAAGRAGRGTRRAPPTAAGPSRARTRR